MLLVNVMCCLFWYVCVAIDYIPTPLHAVDNSGWKREVEEEIRKSIEHILLICNTKHDHVPRVASSELFPFAFEVCLSLCLLIVLIVSS